MKYYIYLLLAALFFSASLALKAGEEGDIDGTDHQPLIKNNRANKNAERPTGFRQTGRNQNNRRTKIRQNSGKQTTIGCGAGPNLGNRIVNGTDAIKNSWPSMVALISNGNFHCGGSLLDRSHVLTAAHCLDKYRTDPTGLTVNLGMHRLLPNMDPQVTRKISKVTIHKDYDGFYYFNDIAILKMATPIRYTKTISPICLPVDYAENTFAKEKSVVIGWGDTKIPGNEDPDVLQQVGQVIQFNSVCKRRYLPTNRYIITKSMICADNPGQDSCQGDSGGPLFHKPEGEQSWIQIGIVSYGQGCADPRYPGVYTRVTSYLKWIEEQINPL